jgi:carbamoyltransferase
MYTLGIQKHHNSSVALFKNLDLIYYNQEERVSRIKKYSGLPINCIREIKKLNYKIDTVVITGYDNFDNDTVGSVLINEKLISSHLKCFAYFKSHHLSHAAKAFYNSNFEESIIIVNDGRGSSYSLSNGDTAFETLSIYEAKFPNKFNCIYKRLYTVSKEKNLKVNYNVEYPWFYKTIPLSINKNTVFDIRNKFDLGNFYSNIADHLGFNLEEGKLMGLQSYGRVNEDICNLINFNDIFISEDTYNALCNKAINLKQYPQFYKNEDNYQNNLDLAKATQLKFENDYLNLVKEFNVKDNLILTGGSALNVVNNYKIRKQINNNLYIEPLCGDEGNSIGIAQFFIHDKLQPIKQKSFNNICLGPSYDYNYELKENEIIKDTSILEIVQLLIEGNIVALYQGGAEAGPRALGNRSLLLDARITDAKKIMNTVKNREAFRPFACSILHEKSKEWFEMDKLEESPYMMYAVEALDIAKQKVSSIVHVDNTCRVQTVKENQNKYLYNILKEFYKITGVPILMNTSFNLAGDPIVETPENAIDTLRKSKLEYLYFADINKLIFIPKGKA